MTSSSTQGLAELVGQYREAPDTEARLACVRALGELVEAPQDVAFALIACLGDRNAAVRAEAAATLGHESFRGGPAAVALAKRLDDSAEPVRDAAMAALMSQRDAATEAAPQLMAALKHGETRIRHYALDLLESLAPKCEAILPAIRLAFTARMNDPDSAIRAKAKQALCALMGGGRRQDAG